jgi:hypothetical protein
MRAGCPPRIRWTPHSPGSHPAPGPRRSSGSGPGPSTHLSEAEAAAKAAEVARREELRAQWELATAARLSYLRELIARGKPPAKLVRNLTEMLCLLPLDAPPIEQIARLLNEPAQVIEKAVTKTGDAGTPLLVLAYTAAGAEENLDNMTRRWASPRRHSPLAQPGRESLGYPLTDVETAVDDEAVSSCRAAGRQTFVVIHGSAGAGRGTDGTVRIRRVGLLGRPTSPARPARATSDCVRQWWPLVGTATTGAGRVGPGRAFG